MGSKGVRLRPEVSQLRGSERIETRSRQKTLRKELLNGKVLDSIYLVDVHVRREDTDEQMHIDGDVTPMR